MTQEEGPSKPQRQRKPARWETMTRVEGRITQQQFTRLQALRQRVNESKQRAKIANPKTPTDDYITLNTFIRVALELLFLFEHEIEGYYTEQSITAELTKIIKELRNSKKD